MEGGQRPVLVDSRAIPMRFEEPDDDSKSTAALTLLSTSESISEHDSVGSTNAATYAPGERLERYPDAQPNPEVSSSPVQIRGEREDGSCIRNTIARRDAAWCSDSKSESGEEQREGAGAGSGVGEGEGAVRT